MKRNILLGFSFAKRDFKQRYIDTGLGQFWYILSPLVMIFIYTVIFSDFMKMRLNIIDNSYAYSIYLVPGLLAWTSFSTTLNRLNGIILSKAGLIKKINVPVYTFHISVALSELYLFVISISLGLVFLLIVKQPITLTFLWLIPVMLLQTLFVFSLGTILSLFTPFFRDLKVAMPIIVQLWFWMTPIIYMKEMISHKYPFLLTYNPFFYFVDIYHNIFLYSKPPELKSLIILVILTLFLLFLAAYLYKKMINEIKDII